MYIYILHVYYIYILYIIVMRMAGLINNNFDWVGDQTLLVQTGDTMDRGPDTIRLNYFIPFRFFNLLIPFVFFIC